VIDEANRQNKKTKQNKTKKPVWLHYILAALSANLIQLIF
jgi:hypothetical protein